MTPVVKITKVCAQPWEPEKVWELWGACGGILAPVTH